MQPFTAIQENRYEDPKHEAEHADFIYVWLSSLNAEATGSIHLLEMTEFNYSLWWDNISLCIKVSLSIHLLIVTLLDSIA